jgi:hypothetical protein
MTMRRRGAGKLENLGGWLRLLDDLPRVLGSSAYAVCTIGAFAMLFLQTRRNMSMRLLVGAFSLALVACTAQPGSAPVPGDKALARPAGEPRQDDIVGEYVVIYVDGAPRVINIKGHEPTVTIGKERIHFQSQCIYADWTYKLDGERISTKPYFVSGSGMCARGLALGEVAIQDGFAGARTIRRLRDGLYLEGEGHRLQMRRVIDQAALATRAVDLAGEWRVAELDGKEIDKSYGIALSADHEQIWWQPECALQYRSYTIQDSRFDSRPVDLSNRAVCDIAVPEEIARIWSAIDASDTIERTHANGVRISGSGRSVTLFSQ